MGRRGGVIVPLRDPAQGSITFSGGGSAGEGEEIREISPFGYLLMGCQIRGVI